MKQPKCVQPEKAKRQLFDLMRSEKSAPGGKHIFGCE